ncbi:hypothetical protein V8J82_04330 [Gymnodinialimonas sp. 2305UL16-5]
MSLSDLWTAIPTGVPCAAWEVFRIFNVLAMFAFRATPLATRKNGGMGSHAHYWD